MRRVEKKREAELKAQGLWFEDDPAEGMEDDPLLKEFDEDGKKT